MKKKNLLKVDPYKLTFETRNFPKEFFQKKVRRSEYL